MLRYVIGGALWFGICTWALARGRAPERIVAGGKLAGTFLTPFVQANVGGHQAELGILAVDAALFGLMLFVSLRWHRWWVLYAAAFTLCQVLTHVARLYSSEVAQYYYASAAIFWSYLGLWALAVGVGQVETVRWRGRGKAKAAV